MKKKIIAILCGLCIGLIACGGKEIATVNAFGKINLEGYGRFIELEEIQYFDKYGNYHYQSICYDKDTKIMWVIENAGQGGIGISPFYVMNADNEPVIGVYTEAMEE